MSGRRIDDHANWTGKAPKGPVYADGAKNKHFSSEGHAGHVGMEYPDTSEMIESVQKKSDSQAMKHKMKPGYRY